MPQYVSISSPKKLEKGRITEILKKHGYELVSREPLSEFSKRDICMFLFVDMKSMHSILGCKEVYRVVGPDPYVRAPLIKFHNTPLLTRLRFYSRVSFKTLTTFIKCYFAPARSIL